MNQPLAWIAKNHGNLVDDLAALVAVPSVSTDGKHQRQIVQSAKVVNGLMSRAGLQHVRTITPPKANPFVFGEWLGAKESPTVLLYSHHDVQPAADEREWTTSPWKLTRRKGRLFGRGSADDKGAIVAQLGAIASFLATQKRLPVNLKMLVEGEEEIGSENLIPFAKKNRKLVDADLIIVCDTGNIATGYPSITYSLRGVVSLIVQVETAREPRHSGFAGGVMPDAAVALNVILSRFFWKNGKVPVPGFYDGIIPLTPQQRKWLKELPFDEAKLREEFGVIPQATLANHVHPFEQTSRQPAVTIIAQEASTMAQRSNQVLSRAIACVSCRLAPGQTAARMKEAMTKVLTSNPPWNARVTITSGRGLDPWMTDPAGPAFDAARDALKAGFGKSPAMIGSGGSIGFVSPMAKLLDDAPVLMLGIEDPHSNAHAPNESLHEADLRKLTLSLAHLFQNLSQLKRVK